MHDTSTTETVVYQNSRRCHRMSDAPHFRRHHWLCRDNLPIKQSEKSQITTPWLTHLHRLPCLALKRMSDTSTMTVNVEECEERNIQRRNVNHQTSTEYYVNVWQCANCPFTGCSRKRENRNSHEITENKRPPAFASKLIAFSCCASLGT